MLLEPVPRQRRPTPAVIKAIKVGQNVIDYATGREMPADKLTVREVHNFKAEPPKRGALRIAKLKHAGDWNIAPQAIPNLMDALRKPPYQLRRRHHPERPVSARSQPDLLPADLYPRPGCACRSPRKTSTPCAGTSSPGAARSSPTPPAAARPSTPPSAGSSPSCSPTTRWSRSPATTSSTPIKVGADLSRRPVHQGGRRRPRLPAARRREDQRPLGRSSTPSSTSAAPSSDTPASSAKAIPTRARSRSPATSSSIRRSLIRLTCHVPGRLKPMNRSPVIRILQPIRFMPS